MADLREGPGASGSATDNHVIKFLHVIEHPRWHLIISNQVLTYYPIIGYPNCLCSVLKSPPPQKKKNHVLTTISSQIHLIDFQEIWEEHLTTVRFFESFLSQCLFIISFVYHFTHVKYPDAQIACDFRMPIASIFCALLFFVTYALFLISTMINSDLFFSTDPLKDRKERWERNGNFIDVSLEVLKKD